MRKLLLTVPLLVALALGCKSKAPVGPGVVIITETTTSTSTSTSTSTTSTTSTIPLPTVAVFRFSPVTPEVNQAVTFTAIDSTPGTGREIVEYRWDFGDGSAPAMGLTATHAYFPSGVYLVTLTVINDLGLQVRSSQPVTVRPVVP